MEHIKMAYARDTLSGRILHISQIKHLPEDDPWGIVCVHCEQPVKICHQEGTTHCTHKGADCTVTPPLLLYAFVKQVVTEEKRMWVPEVQGRDDTTHARTVPARWLDFEQVLDEHTTKAGVPETIGVCDDRYYYIDLAVVALSRESRHRDMQEANVPILWLDLTSLPRDADRNTVVSEVCGPGAERTWWYYPDLVDDHEGNASGAKNRVVPLDE